MNRIKVGYHRPLVKKICPTKLTKKELTYKYWLINQKNYYNNKSKNNDVLNLYFTSYCICILTVSAQGRNYGCMTIVTACLQFSPSSPFLFLNKQLLFPRLWFLLQFNAILGCWGWIRTGLALLLSLVPKPFYVGVRNEVIKKWSMLLISQNHDFGTYT